MSSSTCPTPTVSTSTWEKPTASSTRTASGVAAESPPPLPRVASERMKTWRSSRCSDMRMRSPRIAPPDTGDEGSTASTATRRSATRSCRISAEVRVDLPAPGAPVMPMTWARPGCDHTAAATSAGAESASDSSRARAATSPREAFSYSAAAQPPSAIPGPAALGTGEPGTGELGDRRNEVPERRAGLEDRGGAHLAQAADVA